MIIKYLHLIFDYLTNNSSKKIDIYFQIKEVKLIHFKKAKRVSPLENIRGYKIN